MPAACAFSRPEGGLLDEPAREDRVEARRAGRARVDRSSPLSSSMTRNRPELGIGADVEDVDDVLALDGARAAGLALEAADDLVVVREERLHELDGDALADGDVLALVDDGHPALAEDALEAVAAREHAPDDLRRARTPAAVLDSRRSSGPPQSTSVVQKGRARAARGSSLLLVVPAACKCRRGRGVLLRRTGGLRRSSARRPAPPPRRRAPAPGSSRACPRAPSSSPLRRSASALPRTASAATAAPGCRVAARAHRAAAASRPRSLGAARREPRRRPERRRQAAHRNLPGAAHPRCRGRPRPRARAADGGPAPGYAVPCALAGERVFCADRTGAVHRAARDGSGDRIVAQQPDRRRASPRRTLGGTHAALALSREPPDERGMGQRGVARRRRRGARASLGGRERRDRRSRSRRAGQSVLALSVDARAALTAMHVRPVTFEGARAAGRGRRRLRRRPRATGARRAGGRAARRGPGVGAAPHREGRGHLRPRASCASTIRRASTSRSCGRCTRTASIPAPVAAAAAGATHVGRARAAARAPSPAPRACSSSASSAVRTDLRCPRDVPPTAASPRDVALAADAHGALWVAWVDAGGSWLERSRLHSSAGALAPRAMDEQRFTR